MPRPIFTSLSPNTLPADIKTAARVLARPQAWRGYAAALPALRQNLERAVGSPNAALTSSGRGALYHALRAADIHAGDEVILQAFTCLAVPAAIAWTGATPVYADIAPQTFNMDPRQLESKITPRTQAIIIQHTFGIPAPINTIAAIARQYNLLLIEDIAHGLGGAYGSQPLGSFGDLTIASFGRDKTISSVFGGAVFSRRPEFAARYLKTLATYPPPGNPWVVQQLLHPLLVNAFLPLYFRGNIGKLLLVASQRAGLLSLAVSKQEKTIGARPSFVDHAFPPALIPLLNEQLKQLPAFTERRRAIAARYLQELGGSDYMHDAAVSANWLRFPVWVANPRAVFAAAKRAHILLGDWYTTPIAPATLEQSALTQYVPGSCPEAERAAQHVINVPTHPRLHDDDVTRILEFMKNYD